MAYRIGASEQMHYGICGRKKRDPREVSWQFAGAGPGPLESELAVRGLPAALAAVSLFVFEHQVDCRGGNGLFDKAAADAGGVRTIPVALNDHGAATAGTYTRESRLHFFFALLSSCDCDSKHRLRSGYLFCQCLQATELLFVYGSSQSYYKLRRLDGQWIDNG